MQMIISRADSYMTWAFDKCACLSKILLDVSLQIWSQLLASLIKYVEKNYFETWRLAFREAMSVLLNERVKRMLSSKTHFYDVFFIFV